MKTDSLLKAYEYIEDRCLRYRLPGDQWVAEGVVRVNVSALGRTIRYEPGFFVCEEETNPPVNGNRNRPGEAAEDRLAIEYGPDDWRLIDSWYPARSWKEEGLARYKAVPEAALKAAPKAVPKAALKTAPNTDVNKLGQDTGNANAAGRIWKIPGDILLPFLWEEEDVKRYLAHWNYVVSYQERRERMNRRNGAVEEAASEAGDCAAVVRESDQAWTAILAAVPCVDAADDLLAGYRLLRADRADMGRTAPCPVELMTRSGRWFGAYRKQEQLYICEARHMAPGCPLTFDRRVRRKEIATLLPLYGQWAAAADEEAIRGQARQISISYEYIFTMIRQYAIR